LQNKKGITHKNFFFKQKKILSAVITFLLKIGKKRIIIWTQRTQIPGGKMEAKVVWKDGLGFDAHLDGFTFTIDADQAVGGLNRGPKPKGLTLISLAGCTGMDVISILKKMRVAVDFFEVTTDAVLTDEHPKKFIDISLKLKLKGKDLPPDKIKKAVSLSKERYCGVTATLKPSVNISYEIFTNGNRIE
jgi:putative redox protein